MLTQLRLENFKGHHDTELALPQFAVLVGDNSSGKTSVLEALRLPDQIAEHVNPAFDDLVHRGTNHMRLSFAGTARGEAWTAAISLDAIPERGQRDGWLLDLRGTDNHGRFDHEAGGGPAAAAQTLHRITALLGSTALYRFQADRVAASAYNDHPEAAVADDGSLTAVVLAALKLAGDEAFHRIEAAMQRLVPSLKRILIKPATVGHPSIPKPITGCKPYFDLQAASGIPAHHASQGTLIALALLTVLHSRKRPDLILLDDFDHALHPRTQLELVRIVKELLALDEYKDTQIIATTHSPYVLDELAPSNIIAFALREDGSIASRPLSEHPDAPKVNGALNSGELWNLDAERDWVR